MTSQITVSREGLPLGWAQTTLESLAVLVSTSGKKTLTKDARPAGRYPVIDQGKDTAPGYVDDDSLVVVASTDRPVILFGDHTRVVKLVTFPFVPGADGTKLIQPITEWHAKYAFYCIQGTPLPDRGYGRHFQYLRSAILPVPPFAEQQRIADKLDTVLSRVDASRDRLARVASLLKRFRQSVLAAATSGRLTEDWRVTKQPTRDRAIHQLDSIANERLSLMKRAKAAVDRIRTEEFEIPTAWIWTSLDTLAAKIVDGTHHTPTYVERGVPFVSVKDIRDGLIDFTDTKFISEDEHIELSKRCPIEKGDLLITKSGTIGRTAIVETDMAFSLFVSVALIKPASHDVNMRFINIVLQNWAASIDVATRIVGSTIKNLHLVDMKVLGVPFPSLEEQSEIISRVETLFAFADRLEDRLAHAQTAVGRMTPALLAKAFRGELVPQDPADEPAAVLLKRMAAQREAAPARPRGQRATT